MKVIGITGGVGSGKSAALDYLEKEFQARVIQLDQVAHLLMEPGAHCHEKLTALLGMDIKAADGTIDRKKMGQMVFSQPHLREQVNAIIHPGVKEYIKAEIKKERQAGSLSLLIIEAALLIEDHYDEICDELWYIYVPEEVRMRRLMASRGYSEEKCRAIMGSQLNEKDFRRHCPVVIDNSSDDIKEMYKQIEKEIRVDEIM